MRKQSLLPIFCVLLSCLLLVSGVSYGASVKERMAERIPTINSLKDQGVVGENNKGFLEFRAAEKQGDVISAENKDRGLVYKAIAKKQGATADLVGQRRAKMIVQKGKAGHWFQKGDGSWYKK